MKEGDRWGEGKRGRTRWLRNADMQCSCFKYNSTIPLEIWIHQKHLKFSKAKQYTDIITLVTHTMCAPSPLAADNIFHNVTARSQDHNDFRYPTRSLFIFRARNGKGRHYRLERKNESQGKQFGHIHGCRHLKENR